jgi:hypothetical protein
MFACQECGRKFRTVAESDPISRAEHREYRADKAVIDSPDPYGYDTGR